MKARLLFIIFISTLLILTTIVVSGCGGSEKTAEAKTVAPCSLITQKEAEEALGEEVKEAKTKRNTMGQEICFYEARKSSRFIQISVIQNQAMPKAMREQGQTAGGIFRTLKANISPMKEIAGIGDDAFWGAPGLHFLKGDIYINIAVGNTDDPANLELAKKLAKIVLSKLKN